MIINSQQLFNKRKISAWKQVCRGSLGSEFVVTPENRFPFSTLHYTLPSYLSAACTTARRVSVIHTVSKLSPVIVEQSEDENSLDSPMSRLTQSPAPPTVQLIAQKLGKARLTPRSNRRCLPAKICGDWKQCHCSQSIRPVRTMLNISQRAANSESTTEWITPQVYLSICSTLLSLSMVVTELRIPY